MVYNRVKLDGMQMLITCAHCKKPKADCYVTQISYNRIIGILV